jgi:general secretion pathway protein A
VLVVDEAQSLPLDLLEEIRLLANIETAEGKLLSVVLAGQPELAVRLNEQELRQLKQRIALRCELRALTRDETLIYVAGRIRAAGGVAGQLFTREAVMLMHERAAGIPRTISVIADNALVSGFALSQRPIIAATVVEVCRDLDLAEHSGDEAPTSAAPAMPSADEGSRAAKVAVGHAAASESTRLLTFAGATAEPAPAGPITAADSGSSEEAGDDAAPFGSVAGKRRLFRFF